MTFLEREEIIKYHLSRAYETLKEAEHLAIEGFWNGVANRLYYACFNAVRAVFLNDEIESHSHSGLKTLFHKHYIKGKIFDPKLGETLNRLMNLRDDADYKIKIKFTKEQIEPCIEEARKFIESIEQKITNT